MGRVPLSMATESSEKFDMCPLDATESLSESSTSGIGERLGVGGHDRGKVRKNMG